MLIEELLSTTDDWEEIEALCDDGMDLNTKHIPSRNVNLITNKVTNFECFHLMVFL
jgi:hypothetical protein